NRPHTHRHLHSNGSAHSHEHDHHEEHAHLHGESALAKPVPWALFVICVMGPCGPLIPLLMYPAANHSIAGVVLVASIFSIVTIATMLGMVLVGTFGMSHSPLKRAERYSHAIAGCAILACGLAVQFLGL
ncbi:MAG: sulfite exporter TauE/SafE family protein, partial [Alphaproteobacteria bacterium]